jgi:predicted Fe-Mo cluster-binding NifX family protein
MRKVAIPVFGGRISPVLETCLRVSVIEIEDYREIGRDEIRLDGLGLQERLKIFQEAGINTLICSGISEYFYQLFESANIQVISGIAGDVEEVLHAFKNGRLEQALFYMPGYCGRKMVATNTDRGRGKKKKIGCQLRKKKYTKKGKKT